MTHSVSTCQKLEIDNHPTRIGESLLAFFTIPLYIYKLLTVLGESTCQKLGNNSHTFSRGVMYDQCNKSQSLLAFFTKPLHIYKLLTVLGEPTYQKLEMNNHPTRIDESLLTFFTMPLHIYKLLSVG